MAWPGRAGGGGERFGSAWPLAGTGCQYDGPSSGCITTARPRTVSVWLWLMSLLLYRDVGRQCNPARRLTDRPISAIVAGMTTPRALVLLSLVLTLTLSPAPLAVAQETPRAGGVLKAAMIGEPATLDRHAPHADSA